VSDATLVAQEIQDLATAVGEVAEAVRRAQSPEIRVEMQTPAIEVTLPPIPPSQVSVTVPVPVVNVAAPDVTVQSSVNVPATKPVAYVVNVTKRDVNGFISEFLISPLEV